MASKCKLVARSGVAAVETGGGQGASPREGTGLCPLLQPVPGGPECWDGVGLHRTGSGGLLQSLGWGGVGWSGPGAEPPSLSVPTSLKQSYIQSFRERQTGPSLNSLIASSHAVVDLDYDCSSTVPLTTGSGPAVRV